MKLLSEEGLTLIELMVAMMIFLIVSMGIASTMITELKANGSARQSTFGKQAAEQRLEELRARSFYVPYNTDPAVGTTGDIDLLDLYYPNLSTTPTVDGENWTGRYYSGADAHYTRISPEDDSGITTTVEARFIDSQGAVVVPPSSYNTNSTGNDSPPSNLMDVRVTTSWADRSDQTSYSLASLVSSTGAPVSEYSCANATQGSVDVTGAVMIADTGTSEPYTAIVNGTHGEAHASEVYPCNSILTASGKGGQMTIVGGSTYTGAVAPVTGPPQAYLSVGPTSVGPPSSYPKPTISSSKAAGEIDDESGVMRVQTEGRANVGTQSLQLTNSVGGTPTGTPSGYKRWDFINPTITATSHATGGDDHEDIEAQLTQQEITPDDVETTGSAEIYFGQINILPLQKYPTSTTAYPSAAQGIAFIRDFHASAHATTNGTPDGVEKDITYSFKLFMFNPNHTNCNYLSTGDACYDQIDVDKAHPLTTSILSNANYRLQNAIFTKFQSYSQTDINNAITVLPDGKTVTIAADTPMVQISARYGQEIRWKTSNNAITFLTPAGLQEIGVGKIDISVHQDG